MEQAIKIYYKLGFKETIPYREKFLEEMKFFEMEMCD
jgi:hypothetical protein